MTQNFRDMGFTLVEMLVVLAIVALVLVISIPHATNSGETRKFDAAAQTVAAIVNDTRTAALATNRERSLAVNIEERTVSLSEPKRIFKVPDGIEIEIHTSDGEIKSRTAGIRFFPDGGSTGGRIILAKGTLRREIAISWLTGAVVVSSAETP